MRKNKRFYKICGIAAVICLMALLSGMTALAANNVQDISFKKKVVGSGGNIYYKIKMPTPGILKVKGSVYDDDGVGMHPLAVDVYNTEGKLLSAKYDAQYIADESGVYLNKGTYLLRPRTDNNYWFSLSYQKWGEKSGYSKKKAVSIKRNTLQKGIIGVGDSTNKNDWYKFTLTRSRKVTIKFKTKKNAAYAVIIPGKDTGLATTEELPLSDAEKFAQTLPKGTYYIKVCQKGPKKYTWVFDAYSISWK